MEIRKVENWGVNTYSQSWEVFTNRGVRVKPATKKKVLALVRTFQEAKLLGSRTDVSDLVALRIAAALLNSWNVKRKDNRCLQ